MLELLLRHFCFSTGIAESSSSLGSLTLYPNPTNGNTWLQLPQDGVKYRVTLYNELGQVIELQVQARSSTVELPVSTLAPGVYVVEATNENGVALRTRLLKTE